MMTPVAIQLTLRMMKHFFGEHGSLDIDSNFAINSMFLQQVSPVALSVARTSDPAAAVLENLKERVFSLKWCETW